jgi:osmotically-inducible protein OsmY
MAMDDTDLQQAVLEELEFEPRVNARNVGVVASAGVVTLTGDVSRYSEKTAAVMAAERVHGVTSVADRITVKIPDQSAPDDTQIARSAAAALKLYSSIPAAVHAEVRDGFITLRGEVEQHYERTDAEEAVRHLPGVRGVSNEIIVKPRIKPHAVEQEISDAFQRNALLDARQITVTVSDGTAHLSGHVQSIAEKHAATAAALNVPGIVAFDNHLKVVP